MLGGKQGRPCDRRQPRSSRRWRRRSPISISSMPRPRAIATATRRCARPWWRPRRCKRFRAGEATGILFGRERTGLTNEEIALADELVTFPVNPAFASLNLAQAVLLMSYEWMKTGMGSVEETAFQRAAAAAGEEGRVTGPVRPCRGGARCARLLPSRRQKAEIDRKSARRPHPSILHRLGNPGLARHRLLSRSIHPRSAAWRGSTGAEPHPEQKTEGRPWRRMIPNRSSCSTAASAG